MLEKAVSNVGGAGAMASTGIGLGMGIGMAPVVGQVVSGAAVAAEHCFRCNREIPNHARSCPYCGTPKQRKCPICSKDVVNDIAFCPYCGTKL